MFKHVRAIVFAVAAVLSVAWAAPAVAAPTPWSFVDIGLHEEQGQELLIISGDLPDEVPLPYEAELAVPTGTQLQWIGEVLGGPPAQDPQLQYVKTTVGGSDIYKFTLTKSRTAQFEGVATGVTGTNGANQTTTLAWTAWQDVPSLRIYQRVPRGSQVVQPSEGASMQPGDESSSYYAKTLTNVKAGESVDLTFSYTLPAPGSTSATSGGSTSTITVIIMVGMAAMVVGLLFVAMRRKPATVEAPAQTESSHTPQPKQQSRPAKNEAAVEEVPVPKAGLNSKFLMLGAVGLLIVVMFTVLSDGSTVKDGKISKFFGATSPCSSTSIALMPNQGVDLTRRGKDIVDAFSGHDGVGDVTLTIATSTLDVTFCSSSQTQDSIRQIVEATGLVTLGAAPVASAPTTATVDPTGSKQTATVDTSSGTFDPGTVVLQAGLPAEIAFGQAAGCLTEVVFSSLGVTQSLTSGSTTVALPALEPGTYAFACAMGHQTGSVVVQ